MTHYLVTWHETDGNDATVYDTVVEAATEDAAYEAGSNEAYTYSNVINMESDGDFGFYFPCDCPEDVEWDCPGHGGIVMRSAERFDTEDEARAEQRATHYHTHV